MKRLTILLLSITLWSCQEETNIPETGFFRIYDDVYHEIDYHPIDVTSSETGYIILTAVEQDKSSFFGIELFKVDEEGLFEYKNQSEFTEVLPTGELMTLGDQHYFFGMDPTTYQVQMISIDDSLNANIYQVPYTYPLSAKVAGNNFVLLSYDNLNGESEIAYIDPTDPESVPSQSASYSIGAGADIDGTRLKIISHYYQYDDRPLPFFCGEINSGQVYFNSFYNHTLSLVISDFGTAPTAIVYGQSDNAGIRDLMPITSSSFAMGGYQYTDNFIGANVQITADTSSVGYYNSLGNLAEFRAYTPIDIISYNIGGTDYTLIAAETENRQIGIYIFETSGDLVGKHNVGYLNPYTLATIKAEGDTDNHLLILGTTYVADRFQRIYLSRVPEEEVSTWIQ